MLTYILGKKGEDRKEKERKEVRKIGEDVNVQCCFNRFSLFELC